MTGKSLVDSVDWETEAFFYLCYECVHFLGFEADGTVHVEWVAHDEFLCAALGNHGLNVPHPIFLGCGHCCLQGHGDTDFVCKGEPYAFLAPVNA